MADLKGLRIGEKFAGRYRIVEVIGEGPNGKVYKALDLALDIPVAVKVINPGLFTGEFAQINMIRLYRARAYKNPAILEILEVQPDGPAPFVTSSLAQGLSLRQVMDFHHETGEAFTVMKIRSFMERVFDGMKFIHSMGVHGNIKPENIFILSTHLTIADPYYIVERRLKEGEEIPLTDFYRPPEQLSEPHKDYKASDIYSLALVIGELVSNSPVKPGIPLSEQTPRLTSRFDPTFMRATLQDPHQRHETIDEFANEIFDALAAVEQEGMWERKHHETGSFKAVKVPEGEGVSVEKIDEEATTGATETGTAEEEPDRKGTERVYPLAETEAIEAKPVRKEEKPKQQEQVEPPVETKQEEPVQEKPQEPGPVEAEEPQKPAIEEQVTEPEPREPEPPVEQQKEGEEPEAAAEQTVAQEEEEAEPVILEASEKTDRLPDEEFGTYDDMEEEEKTEVIVRGKIPLERKPTEDKGTEDESFPKVPPEAMEEIEEIDEIEEMPDIEEVEEVDDVEELNEEEMIEAPGIETEAVEMEEEPQDIPVQSVKEVEQVAGEKITSEKMAGFDKVTSGPPPKKASTEKTYLWIGIGVAVLVIILAIVFSGGKKEGKKGSKSAKKTPAVAAVKKDAYIARDAKKIATDASRKNIKDTAVKAMAKADAKVTKDIKKIKDIRKPKTDVTKPPKKQAQKQAPKQPPKPARKPGFIYAADLTCPAGMAKIVLKKEAQDKPGLKLTRLAYCIDRYEYPGKGKMPMGNVSMGKAATICKHHGKRLCSTAEWRRACGPKYPYGNTFREGACNVAASDGTPHTIAPSGMYDKCKSPYGVYDMVGNVEEWTTARRLYGGTVATMGEATTCSRSTKRFLPNRYSGFRCCATPTRKTGK